MNRADWPLYHYRGEVLRVVDGDTIWVRFDSGRRQYSDARTRTSNPSTATSPRSLLPRKMGRW